MHHRANFCLDTWQLHVTRLVCQPSEGLLQFLATRIMTHNICCTEFVSAKELINLFNSPIFLRLINLTIDDANLSFEN